MYIAEDQLRKHMQFIDTTGASATPSDKLYAASLLARINDYRSRHGQQALTLVIGRGIYGGHFLCSHRDGQRAQVVELGEHMVINVSAEDFERSFEPMNQFDEIEQMQDPLALAEALDAAITVMHAAVEFCLDNEQPQAGAVVMSSVALNPLEGLPAQGLVDFLRAICNFGLSEPEQREIDTQIEALARALTELRDAGHIELNMLVVSRFATIEGFGLLSQDDRLSATSRQQCGRVHAQMMARGVHAMLFWGMG